MSQSTRRKCAEIPMDINGSIKLVKGISQHTTCNDVIKMALKKTQTGKENGNPEAYGIFESSYGIERLIPGKSRILKIIRSWGKNKEYKLVFRKVNTKFFASKISEAKRRKLTKCRRCSSDVSLKNPAQPKANSNIIYDCAKKKDFGKSGGRMGHAYENKKQRILNCHSTVSPTNDTNMCSPVPTNMCRNLTGNSDDVGLVRCANVNAYANDVKYAVRKSLKTKPYCASKLFSNTNTEVTEQHEIHTTPKLKFAKKASRKIVHHDMLACDIASQVAGMNSRQGKDALLQKYFADYITYRSPGYGQRDSRYRERGDGAESIEEVFPLGQGDGSECTFSTPKARFLKSPLVYSDSEDSADSGQEEFPTNFDNAFISDASRISDLNCNIPLVSPECGNYLVNTSCNNIDVDQKNAYVGRLVNYSLAEDSIVTDTSCVGSISSEADGNIVHNVSSVSDIVKAVFNENTEVNKDDDMETFMKTKLYDNLSDEGLSSLGSDDEIEIIV